MQGSLEKIFGSRDPKKTPTSSNKSNTPTPSRQLSFSVPKFATEEVVHNQSPRFSNSNMKNGQSKSPMRVNQSGEKQTVGASPARVFQIASSSSPFRAENPAVSAKKSANKTPIGKENSERERETRSLHKMDTAFISLKELTRMAALPTESQLDGSQFLTQEPQPVRSPISGIKSKGRETEEEERVMHSGRRSVPHQANGMEVVTEGKRSVGNGSVHSKLPGSEKKPASERKPASDRKPAASLFDVIQKNKELKENQMVEENGNREETQPEEAKQEQNEGATTQEIRGKYTVAEDVKILDYVKERAGINSLSRLFWQRAVEKEGLLDKKRSIDSLRERYRNQLRNVTEDDLNRMRQWIAENGEKGHITFKTVQVQEAKGKIALVKKMDAIEMDTGNNQSNNGATKSKSKPSKSTKNKANEKKAEAEPKMSEGGNKTANGVRTQISIKFGHVPGVQFNQQEMDVEDIDDDIEEVEEKRPVKVPERKTQDNKRSGMSEISRNVPGQKAQPKRKEYDNMHQIDQALPRKMNKENAVTQASMGFADYSRVQAKGNQKKVVDEESLGQEAWLELQAERYNVTSDRVIDLFYCCSMNRGNLIRYLEGETDVAWNEDEDALLTGNARDAAKKVLVRFKGADNVREREEFLERVAQLRSMISHQPPKKQSTYSSQRMRDFF